MSRAASAKPPPAAAGGDGADGGRHGEGPPSRLRRIVRFGMKVLAVLALIPAVLVPVYMASAGLDADDLTRITNGPIERDWVGFDEIAKVLVVSVMVSEDGQFCAIRGRLGGAQQGAGRSRRPVAGGLDHCNADGQESLPVDLAELCPEKPEIPIALYADAIWTKRRMMEIYLNIAEWGPNIFGIEAAARHHFGRPAKDLTASQAALLAVTLPNPQVRNPAKPSGLMRSLARTVAARARVRATISNASTHEWPRPV